MSDRHSAPRNGILCVGNLLLDKMKTISTYPRESMLAHIRQTEMSCGGGCMNVLFDLAQIDPSLPLWLAGMVGQDQDGEYILSQTTQRNINTDAVCEHKQLATSFTDVMINQDSGERTFFHYTGANAALDIDYIKQLDSSASIAHLAYLLVLPALDQRDEIYGSKGAHALALLQQKGFKTSLDLVSDTEASRFECLVLPALRYVDYLIINDEEACALTSQSLPDSPDSDFFEQLAQDLLDLGVNDTVVIHHPKGASGATLTGESASLSAYTVEKEKVVSTLGAGDAFCAGVLYALHQALPLAQALKFGNASARFNLFARSATNGAVSIQQLLEFIEQQ